MFSQSRRFLLGALLAALPLAAYAGGDYGSVRLHDDEQNLIDSSKQLHNYFEAHALLYNDDKVLGLVRRIGHELRPMPADDYVEYEFYVLRDPSPNAFALPNGHVYVNTGMLARLDDEDQLAAVLAHEISHVAGHHGIIEHRATKKKAITSMVFGGVPIFGGVLAIGLQTSVYGFSRELEQEADDRGASILLASRYDPHALPEMLDTLSQDYEGLDPRFPTIWSTHPETRARAETSRALVASMPKRERSVGAFEPGVLGVRTLTIQDYIRDDYPQTALALADELAKRYPDNARLQQLLADAWQGLGAQPRIEDPAALSNSDKKHNLKDHARKTHEQRLAEQLATETGRAAYEANLARAEQIYRHVLEIDPSYAVAYRGLGEVYEQQKRDRDAAAAYLTYVRSAPDAPDRSLVVTRLKSITVKIKESSNDRS
jgi:beta-barrel assembly-enhancing protease